MKKLLATLTVLLACTASAHAQGLGLAWDDCSSAGTFDKSFTCTVNTGATFNLWQSVTPPPGITDYVGFLSVMDLQSSSPVLPDWWAIGPCRAVTAIAIQQGTGESSCLESTDQAYTFGSDYAVGFGGPNRARMRVLGAFSADEALPLVDTGENAICKLVINRTRTVAAGATPACGGCLTSVCLVLNSILLDTRTIGAAQTVSNGAQNFVTWNNNSGPIPCPGTVPTQARTWGSIKSLYR